jgi:hypothetical protein
MCKAARLGLACGMLIAAIVLIGTQPAMAQGAKAEIFGGGSFLRRTNTFNGWNASITGNILSWLGATADLAGHYDSGLHVHTYTFGPRLAIPQGSGLVPFTQATFGVVQLGGTGSGNGFAAYLGGGVDWIVKEHIAVRLMQLDAQLTSISGNNSNGTRISFGVVFRLGSR